MTTAIQPFTFDALPVRVEVDGDETWFCASDVCAVLDLGTEQTRRLEDDEKGLRSTQTPGGTQEMTWVSEAGLYRLVLASRKPEAKRFQRWVTHDVLPAIRRTGAYAAPSTALDLRDPAALRGLLTQLAEVNLEQQAKIAELAPPAAAWRELSECHGDVNLQTAGKALGLPPNLWIGWLRQQGILFYRGRNLVARQDMLDAGRFVQRVRVQDGEEFVQTLVTPKGISYFGERRPEHLRAPRRAPRQPRLPPPSH